MPILIIGLGGFIRGAVGFGDALVAMPLLALVIAPKVAAPLVALSAASIALTILVKDWRSVEYRSALLLTVSGMVSAPLGVWMVRYADVRIVKGLLGLVVLGFAIASLRNLVTMRLQTNRLAPLFGLVAGVLGGAYNTAGPPLVLFGIMRGWSAKEFRATLQTYCVIGSIWVLVLHAMNGLLTKTVLTTFAQAIPVLIVTTLVGRRLASVMPRQRFLRMVHWLLAIIGISLIAATFTASA